MNRLKECKSVEELKAFIYLHRDLIKKAALPVAVAAAVLFMWVFGAGDKKVVEDGKETGEEYRFEEEESSASGPDGFGGEQGEQEEETEENSAFIYVDISGCVESPGVYRVEEGTRLFQLIDKAGGLTEEADVSGINRAEAVSDGQKIVIYEEGEVYENEQSNAEDASGKININTADEIKLQQIPGIGPVTADKIIQYRNENGKFKSEEELKNVSGIGEKTFENLKEYIKVR